MNAGPISAAKADRGGRKLNRRLVPPQNGSMLFAETTAWWALDISAARPTIDAIVGGDAPTHWVEALLAGVTIADIDENNLHFLGPAGGRARMIGQPFTTFCPPESWQTGAEFILAAVANYPPGAAKSRPITSIAFRDGWAEVSTDEAHPDIVFIAVGGTVADDRSFWAVRASEERYRSLIHHLPGALLQVDSRAMTAIFDNLRDEGVADIGPYLDAHPELVDLSRKIVQVTDANRDALKLFGASRPEELIGAVDFLFAASFDTAKRVIITHFEGRRTYRETTKVSTFDGRLRDVEMVVTYPTPPERVDVTLISLDDITDRLRTEAQLRQLQADYTRATRISMLGELATSIAHEVNQPLSAIATNAETSLRWLSREEPNLVKVHQLTTRIAASARHASDIVQRIRNMAARRPPERVELDLNEVVEEALQFVRYEIESRSIELSVRRGRRLPPVLADRVQLQQVIVNLLLNAVQAQTGQEGLIDVSTFAALDGSVQCTIHDGGPGIANENLGRVFGSFFSTKEEGIGIGLAICQSIITAHGGTIVAANHPRGGAVFRFALPAAGKR
ncbi:ATP-binding protein [Sphingomonas sp. MMSM20]|uniref:sensor histidine kinase n=1 Tax=Sphingomonas lycopersici TaxID=2951807 RepID=UPI0022390A63|nr:ATP-binding protein [Sphingomonas lycopersici]MCW6530786.1 ATP-binding protein [Sphingomonas lycopersici]